MAINIAEKGFFNGDPQAVLNAPLNVVLSVDQYLAEKIKYQQCYKAINEE